MSAIFGIINKNGQPLDEQLIAKIQHVLLHRAIDGKGYWQDTTAFLGNHQLSVTALQQTGFTPPERGDLVITADARIDNRQELSSLLNIEPQLASTLSDSHLILAAYEKWAQDCVLHLEGEFAFAIFSKQTHTLFCATDHIGARPLYYYDTADAFIFASEIKGILALKKTPNTFNEESLIEYFFRHSDQSRTYNSEVFALCGGNTLTIDHNNKARTGKYWMPQPLGKYHFSKDSDWAECLRDRLFKTIENRLHTDMPVGITLSGGLDSSAVACIAGQILQQKNKPLYAFSTVLPEGYTGIETDERKYIGIVGQRVKNLEQTFVEDPGTGPLTNFEASFDMEDSIPNPFFYTDRALQQAMQQKGIRVALSGFGGDLLVSHKGNFVLYQLISQGKFKKAFTLLQESLSHESSFLQLLKTDYIAFTTFYKYYEASKNKDRIDWRTHTPLDQTFTDKYKSAIDHTPPKDQAAWMIQYISSGQMGRLLGNFANTFAAYNIEAATPLLDKNVMEFMLDVPVEQYRVGGSKRSLLRRAMEGILPPEIQWRADKQPYSPDYISRIIKEKEAINDLFNRPGHTSQYIAPERILSQLQSLQPAAGMTSGKDIAGIRIAQGVITAAFLKWLSENGYLFK